MASFNLVYRIYDLMIENMIMYVQILSKDKNGICILL